MISFLDKVKTIKKIEQWDHLISCKLDYMCVRSALGGSPSVEIDMVDKEGQDSYHLSSSSTSGNTFTVVVVKAHCLWSHFFTFIYSLYLNKHISRFLH